MQSKALALMLLAASLMASPAAFAATSDDDAKWISQCVKDNQKEGAKDEVVQKYCACMNDKMSDTETQSISEWEKTHKNEQAACDKEAGWK